MGLHSPILRLIEKSEDVDYSLVVTNMHLASCLWQFVSGDRARGLSYRS